jgi:hypothetical protein
MERTRAPGGILPAPDWVLGRLSMSSKLRVAAISALALVVTGCFAPISVSSHEFDRSGELVISGAGCTEVDPWTGETFVKLGLWSAGEQPLRNTYVTPDESGSWSYTHREHSFMPRPAGLYDVGAQCNHDNEPYPGARVVLTPGTAPQIDGQLLVSATTARPGQVVSVEGDRFVSAAVAGVFLYPSQTHLANVRPGADNVLRAQITIPVDTPPGTHRIIAEGWGPPGGWNGTGPIPSPIWTYAADIKVVP